jgi:hypothetical protein
MTSIKQAVANAMEFAAGVLDTRDLQLEEIESAISRVCLFGRLHSA